MIARKLLIIFFLLSPSFAFSQNKKICISIDDLPVVPYGINDHDFQKKITFNLIKIFDEYKIPAIGYVNETKLYKGNTLDSGKLELLRQWVKNGYELGNHTYSHHSFHKVADSTYFKDILKGETVTRQLMDEHGMELTYFRHPYLHAGNNAEKYSALSNFLDDHNYIIAPVTIDNDDYIFAKAYHNAYQEKDEKLMAEIGKMYVNYMEEKLHFFEEKSQEVFGRNINHTLLIHASLLNAEYLDNLAEMYLENGYGFISQEEAISDEAYSTSITTYTDYGFSWIFRWGFSQGFSNSIRKGDIEVPKKVMEVFNQ